jgi:hypothetical protein
MATIIAASFGYLLVVAPLAVMVGRYIAHQNMERW